MSTDALEQLQSPAQVELLDAIDRLRLEGFDNGELNLPQLIVCGDQSAGKSSVLEAISRVSFPASDTFCTRFASELILRRATAVDFSVTLVPSPNRSDEEKKQISSFIAPPELMALEDFPKVVRLAGEHIDRVRRHEKSKNAFLTDKLVARIRGPHLPPLTLVDLPGLIHAHGETQTSADIDVVRNILNEYMKDQSSIILAVLAADNNKANQEVLQLAKNHDRTGVRTLGIITKPDKVDTGSNSETEWIRRTQVHESGPALGWHVLKNRSFEHKDATPDQRDAHETKFFECSNWSAVPNECRGIASLRTRLSEVLLKSVRDSLPSISSGVEQAIRAGKHTLQSLGQPKSKVLEQQKYLTDISFKLADLIKNSTQGCYSGGFYLGDGAGSVRSRKIRSRLQDTLDSFASHMSLRGHVFDFKDVVPESGSAESLDLSCMPNYGGTNFEPVVTSEFAFLLAIQDYIEQNRGCELPGLLSSKVVTHLFQIQSSAWEAITWHYLDLCWMQVKEFFHQALNNVAPPHTAAAIMDTIVDHRFEEIRDNLLKKLKELLRPYRKGHLVTLRKSALLPAPQPQSRQHTQQNDPEQGVHATELSYEGVSSAASQALAYTSTFYKMALETFMENVAGLIVEDCLVDGLLGLFTPMVVPDLNEELLQSLTAEPIGVAIQRRVNEDRLEVLCEVSSILRRHANAHGSNIKAYRSMHNACSSDGAQKANNVAKSQGLDGPRVDKKQASRSQPTSRDFSPAYAITPPHTPPNWSSEAKQRQRQSSKSPSPLSHDSSRLSPAAQAHAPDSYEEQL